MSAGCLVLTFAKLLCALKLTCRCLDDMRHSLIFAALCLLLLVSWSSAVDSVVAESSAENEEKEKARKRISMV